MPGAVAASQCLSIMLRYLATINSFDLKFPSFTFFLIGRQTVADRILHNTVHGLHKDEEWCKLYTSRKLQHTILHAHVVGNNHKGRYCSCTRHEDIQEERRYSSPHHQPRH
jgi:hypothetical protein